MHRHSTRTYILHTHIEYYIHICILYIYTYMYNSIQTNYTQHVRARARARILIHTQTLTHMFVCRTRNFHVPKHAYTQNGYSTSGCYFTYFAQCFYRGVFFSSVSFFSDSYLCKININSYFHSFISVFFHLPWMWMCVRLRSKKSYTLENCDGNATLT